MKNEFGGYFELDQMSAIQDIESYGHAFQSARAALEVLLVEVKPQRIWMPRYLCGCVFDPVNKLGIEVVLYDIDERFHIVDDINLATGDILYYVNYFGLCQAYQEKLKASGEAVRNDPRHRTHRFR